MRGKYAGWTVGPVELQSTVIQRLLYTDAKTSVKTNDPCQSCAWEAKGG